MNDRPTPDQPQAAAPQAPSPSKAVRWAAICLPLLALVIGIVLVVQRLEATAPPFDIRQDSPEAVFQSAKRMVSEGRADLLPELIYANSEAEREILRAIGGVLGALQEAGYAAADAFPDEIRRIREEAMDAVERGEVGSVMGMMARRIGGRGAMNPGIFADSDDIGADVIHSLLADPYGWIERNSDNVSFNRLGDRMAGLVYSGAPVMLGGMLPVLLELREDDKWYITPPTNLPGVRRAIDNMIEDDQRREMLILVLQSVRQALTDLGDDMRSGEIRTLDHAANKLGEYALPPVGLGMIAFGKYMEIEQEERREQRRQEQSADGG